MPYEIEVIYKKETEDHSGYCSDPGLITTHTTENYVMHKPLTMSSEDIKENFDDYGNYIGYISEFNYTDSCKKGSGYCGCKTKYIAISAKIVQKGSMMSDVLNEIESKEKKNKETSSRHLNKKYKSRQNYRNL